jgi:Tfp pilus assembly protein PilF
MSKDAINREAALALAEALGNLPLALEQAAAYTAQTGLSLADYLSLFRERAAAYVPPDSPSADYPPALAVTFEIAFARISEESPDAADLLTLCAFLAPDDVPLEIFKEATAKEEAEAVQLPEALAAAAANPEALAAAAATLQTYALAKVRGGSFLSMHRLTQAIARDRIGNDEKKKWAEAALMLMYAAFPFNPGDTRTWSPSARLLQHALTAAEHAKAFGVAGELASVLLNNVGMYLLNNAEFVKAQAAFEKSAELCERLFGSAHLQLAIPLNNIGEALRRQGHLDEAAEYLKRALAIDEGAQQPSHTEVGVRLNNIGEVLREKGAYTDARSYYERALVIFETVNPRDALVATILNNIGMSLYQQNDPKGACAYFERALPIDEEVYGPDHPDVAIDLNNLGLAFYKMDDVDSARQYFERALRIFMEHLGGNHPLTLTVKRNLEELDKRDAGDISSE